LAVKKSGFEKDEWRFKSNLWGRQMGLRGIPEPNVRVEIRAVRLERGKKWQWWYGRRSGVQGANAGDGVAFSVRLEKVGCAELKKPGRRAKSSRDDMGVLIGQSFEL
jgi:hypothetical protein